MRYGYGKRPTSGRVFEEKDTPESFCTRADKMKPTAQNLRELTARADFSFGKDRPEAVAQKLRDFSGDVGAAHMSYDMCG